MNQNQYYTPTLNDLREGFKFELQVYDYDTDDYIDEWEQHEFDVRSGLGHDEYHTFTEGRVRALTQEVPYQLNPSVKVYNMEDNILPPGVDWDMAGAYIRNGESYDGYLNYNDRVLLIEESRPFPIPKEVFEKLFINR